ncbi:hypothetical protein DSCW_18270 [Desulfosarcina widdelii]|uniref:Anti-CBASS protein Acb1-like N-terminal domain-containing protein n=1 Tax=Desulfosarcina widdelii TaxID=947919 RepID=A0A5K7Z171_9BACT|nr:DUF1073 domain-containing protein [Desulfosarcina widdelii]BBO74410.1 hypothetical protein DSCW_18270 [Desulfosarcina widdelii]
MTDLDRKIAAFEARSGKPTHTRHDVYVNAYSGFGGSKDPLQRTRFMGGLVLSQIELDELYRFFWLPRRIVNALPEDACRQRINLAIEDPEEGARILRRMEELKAWQIFEEALRLSRLHGGAVVIVGATDGQDPEEPLNAKSIKRVGSLTVLDRWQLSQAKLYDDPLAPNFGLPETYRLQAANAAPISSGAVIHESRVIRFDGAWLPDRLRIQNNGWHDSVIIAINEQLKQFGISIQAVAVLFQDFITKTLKIPNLAEMIANGEEATLQARIQYAVSNMSSLGVSLIGENEEFDKMQTPITGLVDLLDKYMDLVSAASDIPKTRLFGQQLGTLSGADETTRNYYDRIKAYQQKHLRGPVTCLIELLRAEKKAPAGGWSFEFAPLWQPTDKEKADTRKTVAETDQIYILNQVLTPEEVAVSRFGADGYSMETTVSTEADEDGVEKVSQEEDDRGGDE